MAQWNSHQVYALRPITMPAMSSTYEVRIFSLTNTVSCSPKTNSTLITKLPLAEPISQGPLTPASSNMRADSRRALGG